MLALHLLMIAAGLALIFWGLPAAHRLKSPLDKAAAFGILSGVVIALLGVLLTMAPDFFKR
ncbi:hypothetical protein LPW11_08775 [Geomonas sp. RF6]|uniref:hypothetical protein n=1 Tax=Geomonas sp. RF6 TaxID=2897342 RepID=UPI001E59FE94|nr:hypothetical protein [Geomonas sp. RF6]UFS72272.1 hypothetical protein LPW11_08775 [Geomonas sp. RF6]